MSTIQQPHSVNITPLGIPTFDHGRQQRVYRYWPLDQSQMPIPVQRLWLYKRQRPDEWDIFCDCTPLPGTFGTAARIWTVRQPSSNFFNLTFVGCGRTRHRCAFRAGLDQIYQSVLALGPFPNPNYPPPPTPPPPPPPPAMPAVPAAAPAQQVPPVPFPLALDPSSPLPSSPPSTEDHLLNSDPASGSPKTPDPQEIFEEIWAALQEYQEDPAHQGGVSFDSATSLQSLTASVLSELAQLFAGQPDVIVTPDGAIHYEPDLFLKNAPLSQGNASGSGGSTSINNENDQDWFSSDGDVTLVDIEHNDVKAAISDGLVKTERILHGDGTQAQPYDLTTAEYTTTGITAAANQTFMFVELCDACGDDLENHDTAACVANMGWL
ncbi:hypothetical protein F5880DRAFT_1618067 [Lentinula raphanica]|nr:hypothetical protein F5880DRAFT_1618067 [Lentinula raphanica]